MPNTGIFLFVFQFFRKMRFQALRTMGAKEGGSDRVIFRLFIQKSRFKSLDPPAFALKCIKISQLIKNIEDLINI